MQFGWIVQGPGTYWLGDGTFVRNPMLAHVFHDPALAKSQARKIFPKGNLTLHYLQAIPCALTCGNNEWEAIEEDEDGALLPISLHS